MTIPLADLASSLFLALSALGLVVIFLEFLCLRRHLRQPDRSPRTTPAVSVLKPLCGRDDGLLENLASFATLDYPQYEVLLGLRSMEDGAFAVARAAVDLWPGKFRVVFQRGVPGANPKVNQLITLAAEARHEILVVSDSNVRVRPDYLKGIAQLFEDESVGLVTHPIAGKGERRLGSKLDHMHLMGTVAPAVVAAKLLGRDIVVGKSMAFRKADLKALGGFEVVKDVLAEDFCLGVFVSTRLEKRVAVAIRPIENVSQRQSVADFARRHARWSVLQHQAVGTVPYLFELTLNPVLLALFAAFVAPTVTTFALLLFVCMARALLDGACAMELRTGGLGLKQLVLVPLKDVLLGAAWLWGLLKRDVVWRGNRIRVGPGTRILSPDAGRLEPEFAAEPQWCDGAVVPATSALGTASAQVTMLARVMRAWRREPPIPP